VQAQAISDADFEQLVAQLEQSPMGDRSVRIATAAQFCFFTSLQVSCSVAHTTVPQLTVQFVALNAFRPITSISEVLQSWGTISAVFMLLWVPKQIPPALTHLISAGIVLLMQALLEPTPVATRHVSTTTWVFLISQVLFTGHHADGYIRQHV